MDQKQCEKSCDGGSSQCEPPSQRLSPHVVFTADSFGSGSLASDEKGPVGHVGKFILGSDDTCSNSPLEEEFYKDFPPNAPIIFERIDSDNIIYEEKKKKCKIIGDRYVMGDLLGEGSYGKVKEGLDIVTLSRKAIKIMKKQKLRRIPNGEINVSREIAVMRTLNHRHVLKLSDVFIDHEKEKMYMVMEYCATGLQTLMEESPKGKFPEWQAHGYFLQVLDGLEYLHGVGVIHNDIKPGNLLLTTGNVLKITDFGVAEVLSRFCSSDEMYNNQQTPAFQPPEKANGWESYPGYKVDVWSSGVTLFNLVTGRYPFEGDNIYRLLNNIGQNEFVIPEDLSENQALSSLLLGMLKKSPSERFSIDDCRRHEWCRKKHSKIDEEVPLRIHSPGGHGADGLSTVLPYLQILHFGSSAIMDERDEGGRRGDVCRLIINDGARMAPPGGSPLITVEEVDGKDSAGTCDDLGEGCVQFPRSTSDVSNPSRIALAGSAGVLEFTAPPMRQSASEKIVQSAASSVTTAARRSASSATRDKMGRVCLPFRRKDEEVRGSSSRHSRPCSIS